MITYTATQQHLDLSRALTRLFLAIPKCTPHNTIPFPSSFRLRLSVVFFCHSPNPKSHPSLPSDPASSEPAAVSLLLYLMQASHGREDILSLADGAYVQATYVRCHIRNGQKLSSVRSGNCISSCLLSLHFRCGIPHTFVVKLSVNFWAPKFICQISSTVPSLFVRSHTTSHGQRASRHVCLRPLLSPLSSPMATRDNGWCLRAYRISIKLLYDIICYSHG